MTIFTLIFKLQTDLEVYHLPNENVHLSSKIAELNLKLYLFSTHVTNMLRPVKTLGIDLIC